MPTGWTDNVVPGTRIKAVHINELRRAVDNYRFAIGVPRGGWTDNPVTRSTRIRAVHFTELKAAIQALWNFHQQGPLPAWTAGSAPSSARQIRASDVTNLRIWTDLTDPPPPTIGMNVNPEQQCARPTVAQLIAAKFEGVRLTPTSAQANKDYVSAARANGLQVVAVVGTGSEPNYVPPDTSVVLQVYNEPDDPNPSKYRTPAQYAAMYADWRVNYPGYTIFTAGFSTGDAAYYSQFLDALAVNHPGVDLPYAVAIHLYTLSPAEAVTKVGQYTSINPAIPAVVTEWNHSANQDNLIARFQDALSKPGTEEGVARIWNSWYPWCTAMDITTNGMVVPTVQYPNGVSTDECTELVGHLGGTCPSPS